MPADSLARRTLKRVLHPLMTERTYRFTQAVAKAWDIRNGSWSEPELAIVPYAVKPGDVVLDIGANYGLYTYHLTRRVGPGGKVYAFEPVPFTYETCKSVSRLIRFTRADIIPKGCGDRSTRVAFTVPVQRSGAISAGQSHIAGRNDEREGKEVYSPFDATEEVWCDVVAVDEFLPDLTNVTFVKSDIEGADLLALRGAAKTIERNRPTVMTEIKTWFLDGYGIQAQEFQEFFSALGYAMYHLNASANPPRLDPCTVEELGAFDSDNFIFIHHSRRERFAPLLIDQHA